MAERELTEKQKRFLEVLFHESIMGDFEKAKLAAGYSENTMASSIVESLKEELIEHTKLYLARNAPKAAFGILGVMDKPGARGASVKLSAAKEVLDRVGVVKTEKIEMRGAAFILPPKEEN